MLHCWSILIDLFVIVLDLDEGFIQRRLRILTSLDFFYVLVMFVCFMFISMIFSSGVICGCVLVWYARP
ncbi:hypothetical protein Bca4012_058719 [Brassica carinata]